MISAFANSLKIKELRKKIFFTLGIMALCRVAANVPCPGIDPDALQKIFEQLEQSSGGSQGIVGMVNLFSGGALQRFAVAALGIMPYISASIIMQLMTPVVPQLEKLKREGESGHQKITQWTRYLTLVICIIQGGLLAKGMLNPSALLGQRVPDIVVNPGGAFIVTTVIILTCGTMILMWLGEQITDHGIGNGASLIITVGILEQLPSAVYGMWSLFRTQGTGEQQFTVIHICILLALFILVTAATVTLTVGVRRIPVQYAKAMAGRKGSSSQSSYIPLRVNFANVMPIIFASAILMFPPIIINFLSSRVSWMGYLGSLFAYGSLSYMVLYAGLLILFSFFWVANQFNPIQIADDLKRQGAYVPGIRPGKPTSDYLDKSMTRVTTAGALFLTALALCPMIFTQQLNIPFLIASFFGGASLLIMVGVMLDTIRQIESHLLMHHYDGFLERGHMRSRRNLK